MPPKYCKHATRRERESLQYPDLNWVKSSPFSAAQDKEIHQSFPGTKNLLSTKFLKMCHLYQKYRELGGPTIIPSLGAWYPLVYWKRFLVKKYNNGVMHECQQRALKSLDAEFFGAESSSYFGESYSKNQLSDLKWKQKQVELLQSRDEDKCTMSNWCADNQIPQRTMCDWLINPFYNLKIRQEVIDIPQWLAKGSGSGPNFQVVPVNPDVEMMSDADNLLTFCTHNLVIQDNYDEKRLTVKNLPRGIIHCHDNEDDNDSIRSRVKKCYEKSRQAHTCSRRDCNFCDWRNFEAAQFNSSYDTTSSFLNTDEYDDELERKQVFADFFSDFEHPLFTDPTFQKTTYMTKDKSGCRVTTTSNGIEGVYHKQDADRILSNITFARRQSTATFDSHYQSDSLLNQEETNRHNRLDEHDGDTNNNEEGLVFIEDAVNINDDKYPLINNTLATGTTQDETNEDDDTSSVDSTESLVPLHDITDDTGHKETEDSPCPISTLFNVKIGKGGNVEISELNGIDTDSRFVNLLGFSHRWAELDPKDRRRTILLLRDAIEWLLVNVFPRIRHLLPDESRDIVSLDSIVDNDNEEEIQQLWFVHNHIVVCCLFNRIIKCVPWCYIEPLELLKKSAMSEPQLRIIHQIRSWLIDRACKNRWVKKECFIDDSETTMPVWVIPLLYLLACHCSGGAHSKLKRTKRLVAPGIAECHVLKRDRYFVNPFTAHAYTNATNWLPYKLKGTHVVQLQPWLHGGGGSEYGTRWSMSFQLKDPRRKADGRKDTKECGLSRAVQSCAFPLSCPQSTMDHLDGHQHNGLSNVENCPKPENLDRIGIAILVHPSHVSFYSSIRIVVDGTTMYSSVPFIANPMDSSCFSCAT